MNRRSFFFGLAGLASAACLRFPGAGFDDASAASSQSYSAPGFRLTGVTAAAGIDFSHYSGAFGGKLLPETLGSGCAFLDYDGDGWQDILLINSMD